MSETFEKISKVLDGDEAAPPGGREVEVARFDIMGVMNQIYLAFDPSVLTGEALKFVLASDFDSHVARLQSENAALQQRLTIADQRVDDLEGELTKARELLSEGEYYGPSRWNQRVVLFLAGGQSATAARLEPVHGDVLPPIGSKVQIELASSGWHEQTVTGYYAWPSHGLDKNVHRVFVRVKDAEGTPNARLLADIRTPAPAIPQ